MTFFFVSYCYPILRISNYFFQIESPFKGCTCRGRAGASYLSQRMQPPVVIAVRMQTFRIIVVLKTLVGQVLVLE